MRPATGVAVSVRTHTPGSPVGSRLRIARIASTVWRKRLDEMRFVEADRGVDRGQAGFERE
ncbi:MAG: hypothetical protein ACLP8S_26915 [Solirubrobacteraceae bacterium]